MNDQDTTRLSRLIAILTQLQTKRLITATDLANKFSVSIRTIYRDIRALEQSGIPIMTQEGKGYTLMDHYRLPPVMFTESEANALITAEQIVIKNKDASLVKEFTEAINKIKSVLQNNTKDKVNLLSSRILFAKSIQNNTSNYMSVLQLALTNYTLAEIDYHSPESNETTRRIVEPFALLSTQDNWLLVAWCRMRKDFRTFRLDRIQQLEILKENFVPHKLTLQEYFQRFGK